MVNKLTNTVKPLDEVDKINEIIDALDDVSVAFDNSTITKNASDQLQTVAVKDNRSGNAIKTWTGTLSQMPATTNATTLYFKTDDVINNGSIVNDLNGKADVDLTNVNNNGTSRGASWSLPSSTYIDLTLGASGTTYTAPANGKFLAGNNTFGTNNPYLVMERYTNGILTDYSRENGGTSGDAGFVGINVFKGDVIVFYYNCNVNRLFRFYYAEGSKWENS